MNTPVLKKLRINEIQKILIINMPAEVSDIFEGLQYDTKAIKGKEGYYDTVIIFSAVQKELEKFCRDLDKAGKYDCLFWVCYPKGTGKIKSDIKRDTVWLAFEQIGLHAVTQIAIDDTWSALRARPDGV